MATTSQLHTLQVYELFAWSFSYPLYSQPDLYACDHCWPAQQALSAGHFENFTLSAYAWTVSTLLLLAGSSLLTSATVTSMLL